VRGVEHWIPIVKDGKTQKRAGDST